MILNSVNKALYRMRFASAVEEEDDDLITQSQHLEEKRRRGQQLVTIQAFLQSSLDKENELSVVLQWLRNMSEWHSAKSCSKCFRIGPKCFSN